MPQPDPPNWEHNRAVYSTLVPGDAVQASGEPGKGRDISSLRDSFVRWARNEEQMYAHGEERPLGSYLGIMGVYSALFTGFTMATLLSRKRMPSGFSGRDLALVGLAAHKIARLVTKDPVTSPLRAPFTRFEGTSGEAELSESVRGTGIQNAIGELLTCPFCLDQWFATVLLFGLVLLPEQTRFVATLFTAVSIADVAQHLYAHLEE